MANQLAIRKLIVSVVMMFMVVPWGTFCWAQSESIVLHNGTEVNNAGDILECLTCHDDVTAKMGGFQLLRLGAEPNPLGSHPVDVDYLSGKTHKGVYADQSELVANGLRLLDGKVVCTTCHDLRLQTAYHLAVKSDRSKICFVCHKI